MLYILTIYSLTYFRPISILKTNLPEFFVFCKKWMDLYFVLVPPYVVIPRGQSVMDLTKKILPAIKLIYVYIIPNLRLHLSFFLG